MARSSRRGITRLHKTAWAWPSPLLYNSQQRRRERKVLDRGTKDKNTTEGRASENRVESKRSSQKCKRRGFRSVDLGNTVSGGHQPSPHLAERKRGVFKTPPSGGRTGSCCGHLFVQKLRSQRNGGRHVGGDQQKALGERGKSLTTCVERKPRAPRIRYSVRLKEGFIMWAGRS